MPATADRLVKYSSKILKEILIDDQKVAEVYRLFAA